MLQNSGCVELYKGKKICQVVIGLNEGERMAKVVAESPRFVDLIVAVDDGSTDRTCCFLKSIKDRRLMIIRHASNKGVGASVLDGHRAAIARRMDISVVTAGDGQMDPKYMPALLDAIIEGGCDYAKGNRFASPGLLKGMPPLRIFGSILLTFLNMVASGYWNVRDPQNGYTAIKVSTLKKLGLGKIARRYQFENDMLIRLNILGAKVKDVPMPARYGSEKSKIRLASYIPQTSLFLLNGLIHRLRAKYLPKISSAPAGKS